MVVPCRNIHSWHGDKVDSRDFRREIHPLEILVPQNGAMRRVDRQVVVETLPTLGIFSIVSGCSWRRLTGIETRSTSDGFFLRLHTKKNRISFNKM